MPPQEAGHIIRRAIAQPHPDDLRWRAVHHAETVEVFVLCDEQRVPLGQSAYAPTGTVTPGQQATAPEDPLPAITRPGTIA